MTTPTLDAPPVDAGHVQPLVVHFDDLDPMGIVHNARYAVLLERAISVYWAERGHSFAGGRPTAPDVVHAVREFSISYRAPIRGTGEIAVHFWVDTLGRTSAEYGFRFLSADHSVVHADGRRGIVRLDPVTFRPAPWTDGGRAVASTLLRR